MRQTIRLITVISLLLSSGIAAAKSPKTELVTIRRINQTEATSECIGVPKTPLCALETFIACTTRGNIDLCRKVGVSRISFDERIVSAVYIVLTQQTLRAEDIPAHLKHVEWLRPGYVEMEYIKRTHLADGTIWPGIGWQEYGVSIKPVGDEWHVASWAAMGEEDFAE